MKNNFEEENYLFILDAEKIFMNNDEKKIKIIKKKKKVKKEKNPKENDSLNNSFDFNQYFNEPLNEKVLGYLSKKLHLHINISTEKDNENSLLGKELLNLLDYPSGNEFLEFFKTWNFRRKKRNVLLI